MNNWHVWVSVFIVPMIHVHAPQVGRGLGLALSVKIAKALGGELSFAHSPLGGLRCKLSFPKNQILKDFKESCMKHILLVEDEIELAQLVRDYLEAAGI